MKPTCRWVRSVTSVQPSTARRRPPDLSPVVNDDTADMGSSALTSGPYLTR